MIQFCVFSAYEIIKRETPFVFTKSNAVSDVYDSDKLKIFLLLWAEICKTNWNTIETTIESIDLNFLYQ